MNGEKIMPFQALCSEMAETRENIVRLFASVYDKTACQIPTIFRVP